MRGTWGRWAGALLLGLIVCGVARADDPQVRVRLRTGEEVQGALLGFTGGQFRVRTGEGERVLAEADVLEVRVESGDPGPRFQARHEPPTLTGEGEVGGIRLRWEASPESMYVVVKTVILERSPADPQPAWQEVQRFSDVSDAEGEWLDEGALPGKEYLYRVVTLADIDREDPLVQQERLTLPAADARRASPPFAPAAARRSFEARCLAVSPASPGQRELLLELKVLDPPSGRSWTNSLLRVREGQELHLGGSGPATLKQVRVEAGPQRLSAVLAHGGEEVTVASAPDASDGLLVTPAPAAGVAAQPEAAAAAIASALASHETLDLHLEHASVAVTAKLLAERGALSVLGLGSGPLPPVSLRLRSVRLGEAWRLFLATTRLEATPVGEVLCLHEPGRLRGHQPVELGPLAARRVDVDTGRVLLREALEALGVAGGADVVLSAGARQLLGEGDVRLGFARLRGASLAGAVSAVCAAEPLLRWTVRGNVILVYQEGERCGPEDAAASLLSTLRSYHGLTEGNGGAPPNVWAALDRSLRNLLSPRLQAQSEGGFDSELGRAWRKAWQEWERSFDGPREPETLVRAGLFVQDAQGRWCLDAAPPRANEAARREALEEAQRKADARDWEGALQLLDRALTDTPDDPHARGLRAFVRGSRGDLAGARADLQRALALAPGDARALRLLATLQAQAGELDQASLTADRLVTSRPADPESYLLRARVHLERRAGPSALQDVEQAQALDPGSTQALHLGAAALVQMERLEEALPMAMRLVELRPDDPSAWELRAGVLTRMGRAEEARGALQRAIELSPEGPEAERRRGLLKLLESGSAPALAEQADPRDLARRAATRAMRGRPATSLAEVERSLKAAPADPANLDLAVQVLLGLDQVQRAGEVVELLLKAAPGEAHAHVRSAEVLLAQRRPADALRAAEQALALDPQRRDRGDALRAAAFANLSTGDTPAAHELLTRWTEVEPSNAEAWELRAEVRVLQRDLDGALADLDRAIGLSQGAEEQARLQRAHEELRRRRAR